MKHYNRQFEVERASVNAGAGTFEAVLFTDGEASDGHILDMKGGKVPVKMPLFVNHSADPTTQLGSLHFADKDDHKIRVRGEVFTEGEGAPLEVRKDLLAKMAAGHVSRMSGRWDASDKDAVRRINLPSDHPAFVDDSKETESRKRWGYYFKKWQAQEGSIVGLGADPQAVMRWARDEESPECVRDFWRGQVPEAQEQGLLDNLGNAVREALAAGVDACEVGDFLNGVMPMGESGTLALNVEAIRGRVLEVVPAGEAEVRPTDEDDGAAAYDEAFAVITERLDAIEAGLAEQAQPKPATATEVQERVETEDEPLPSAMPPREVIAELSEGLDAAKGRVVERFRAEITKARGKVTQNE